VDEYARGRTPNPCVRCNDWLKFGKLHDYAKQIGADFVASGHYARIDSGKWAMAATEPAAPPPARPRSPRTSPTSSSAHRASALADMLLPIGGMATKAEVRELAKSYGLPVFDKPDSRRSASSPTTTTPASSNAAARCSPRGRYSSTPEGNIVGTHQGQHRFTIGQRRGVGVALGHPIYVVDKRPDTNEVVVGEPDDLLSTACTVAEPNWLIDPPAPGQWLPVLAQHRYNADPVPATVALLPEPGSVPTPSGRPGTFDLRFDSPERAVTPGQAVVLFDRADPTLVLGGGWIASVRR
jgi:tRNA-specific 2-thiouridylase